MQTVKGMIQVEGATYRIARVLPHIYEAIRILDNQVAGWFTSDLSVIAPHAVDLFTLRTVAQEAVKKGKTSWLGRAPTLPAPPPESAEVSGVRSVATLAPTSAEGILEVLRARGGG